ncbi:hypothetical protein LAZ67_X002427 [Cordylochernes scorpioides]|uniref:Uncharacterized protein n=1 Tax=Cordylochernes scorpioides TaxID=51811 RepID=A0ABY6LXL8_9ARAC|nr:hypothetical protein LAZ67_X002427 [Cordylochernes scorpioides]
MALQKHSYAYLIKTKLQSIEQKMVDWDQRLGAVETSLKKGMEAVTANDARVLRLEEHVESMERKLTENNLVIYGLNGTENENSDETLTKDYSPKIRDQRRILNAKRKELSERGTKAKLRDNRLLVNGIEQNPGPPTKKQTTLTASVHSGERESIDGELKMLILNMATEIKSLGERIDIRLTKIETRMDDWDKRFCNIEEKLTKCIESQQATEKLASCNSLKVNELEARVEFFETRLHEPNLMFYGIEREGDKNQADCNLKIQNIIRDKMEIGDDLKITKCHRLSRGSNAPVLVVVPDYTDRAKIFKNAYKLRDTKILISKDYSKNVREQRRILIAKRKELGERGIKSKLRDNKLFVNDKVCKVMNGQVVDSTGVAI